MTIVIPMAGEGQRFKDAGYELPKPLIDVCGKPMIERVLENLNMDGRYIFFTRKEHEEKFGLSTLLKKIAPDCLILESNKKTEGAAQSVYNAINHFHINEDLFIANSDQLIYGDFPKIGDGTLYTFQALDRNPKWSYCDAHQGVVYGVAEKRAISDIANTGAYWFKNLKYYNVAYHSMVNQDIRVNGEFYVAPVYNELIKAKFDIRHSHVNKMIGLGTPEDLEDYVKHYLDQKGE
jgi:NDP-sugar pyrophosphorylase family protein